MDPRDRRVREEIDHHLALLEAQLIDEGWEAEAARREARRRFGDPEDVERRTSTSGPRSVAGGWLDSLRQDLRFARRLMTRSPAMTALTIGTLAVGVAATTVVFSVVHAVVLAPLPFENPDRIVHVSQTSPQGRPYSISEPNFVDVEARQRSFEAVAGIEWTTPVLSGLGPAESVNGLGVSHDFFTILGVEFTRGRSFLREEDAYGAERRVVVLSEAAADRRFGGDGEVVGRSLILDGLSHTVVGVARSGEAWPGIDVFTPLAPNPDEFRDDQRLEAIARLRDGVTLTAAREDVTQIAADLSVEYPESNDGWGAQVQPVRSWLIRPELSRLGALLLGAVGVFLLMTCASLSNLMVARASTRVREMGMRMALGASRGRVWSQLVVEALLVAGIGTVLAVVLSYRGIGLLQAWGPADVARLADATIDASMLGLALSAAVVTSLVAGLAPAALLSRTTGAGALRAGGRGSTGSERRLRDGLVVAQFGLTVLVVVGAGLLGRSFVELQRVDMGFEAGGVVRFGVRLPANRFDQRARTDYLERLADEVEALPGVVAVGGATVAPFSAMRPSNFVARSDAEPGRQEDFQPVSWRAISGAYFDAAGIELRAGRVFGPEDRVSPGERVANPPIIIDETLAELLFPQEDPIGRLVTWFLPGGRQCVVVGVVANARDERIDVVPRPRVYRPFDYTFWDQPVVLVRTASDPEELVPALREAAVRVDPDVPAIAPTAVLDDVRQTLAWPRVSLIVLSAFGVIALALSALGIYGVTTFNVARRRREIGVRVALGAEVAGVRWLVLRHTLRLAVVGIAIGCVLAWLGSGVLSAFLYDVSARDPLTYAIVPFALIVVALAATWLPTQRVLALRPSEALADD
ncbi:MAG: ABC transporter permease [Gemmatimonadota bacterium]